MIFIADCFIEPIDNFVNNAENCLEKVLKKRSGCETFDEFRIWSYKYVKLQSRNYYLQVIQSSVLFPFLSLK